MKNENEKAEYNVDARAIIKKLLESLDMNAADFAKAIGINYQRVFDLQRGRVKKFNPGIVTLITERFPNVNKTFLYTGEGEVFIQDVQTQQTAGPTKPQPNTQVTPQSLPTDPSALLHKVMEMLDDINQRAFALVERERVLIDREQKLVEADRLLADKARQLGQPYKSVYSE